MQTGSTESTQPGSPQEAARAREQRKIALHMPVDVRSMSMAVIATILCIGALRVASEIVIPILFGVMLSYALGPVVNRLERWRIQRALAATVVLSVILAAFFWGMWRLGDQADGLIDTIPRVSEKIKAISQHAGSKTSTLERMQKAATELAAAAEASAAANAASSTASRPDSPARTPTPSAPTPAATSSMHANPQIDVRSYVLAGTVGVMSFLGQLAIVVFLALFLLSAGNTFRRKMIKLAGPKFSQKKITIETLDEITEQIQRYLVVQVGVSLVVGVATWLAFWMLGVEQSAAWGVVAAITNLIPYVGALIVGAGASVFALVQFDTPAMALLVGATSFGIHTVIGNVLTPWWMGKASKMSPVAVFLAVIVFGWLWGVAGLILGVPILLVAKSVCDRVEELKSLGELLGE